jgi:hypothetical protein
MLINQCINPTVVGGDANNSTNTERSLPLSKIAYFAIMNNHFFKAILFSFLVVSASSKAQTFYGYVTPQFQKIKSASFNKFITGYEAVQKNQLTDGRVKNGTGTGFAIGIGISNAPNNNNIFSLEYSRSSDQYSAAFVQGGVRKFALQNNYISFNFGFPIGDVENDAFLIVMPEFGAGLGNAIVVSSYKQGATPVNSSALDGRYKSFHGNLMGGATVIFNFGGVGLKASARYNLPMFPTGLKDKSKPYGTDRLPVDYSAWTVNPSDYMGSEVKDDFKYFQLGLGICVLLN